jgi:two-component system sensor histidine kinase TctE
MRARLLLGILLPVTALLALNTASIFRQARQAADVAYDRTLLASAKAIGELLEVAGTPEAPRLVGQVPYSALEAFEADNRSRIYFKVTGFQGEMVSGFDELPSWHGRLPDRSAYAALVDFYDERVRGERVRVAVLVQPVSGQSGMGMATIQVAETLELRDTLARRMLVDTLWHQAALLLVITAVVWLAVRRATQPVLALSASIRQRADDDLSPLQADQVPRELTPLLDATNGAMARLSQAVANQRRFVRDAAHQLRTPLAVLKTQLQSARRGDVAPELALAEMATTVDRATELANQMLALAKVEQLRQQGDAPALRWDRIVRAVALDLAPLVAGADLDFELDAAPLTVRGHEWALRELTRNLLHNAIGHSPPGAPLAVRLVADQGQAQLTIADSGPGLSAAARERLFQPFASSSDHGAARGGSGLGLAICHDIVATLGGQLRLQNRLDGDRVTGLDANVRLPIADNVGPS